MAALTDFKSDHGNLGCHCEFLEVPYIMSLRHGKLQSFLPCVDLKRALVGKFAGNDHP